MAELLLPFAANSPEKLAVADEFGSTDWKNFNKRVNQLIHALRGQGLKTGDAFSVLSGNRREYVEAFAAAAHGGWLLVPINWHLVASEICYILENSESKAFLIDSRFCELGMQTVSLESAPNISPIVVMGECERDISTRDTNIFTYEKILSEEKSHEPENQSLGGPMFYTSGTTGHPKGVKSALSQTGTCLLYTSPSPRDRQKSRMPSSA